MGRLEKVVGWFVLLAIVLLATGFFYYLYHTAIRKGWFAQKIQFCTCLNSAADVKIGDPVKMIGTTIGEVTRIEPNEPFAGYALTIYFEVRHDRKGSCGYIWSDSVVRIQSSDLFGGRNLEVVRGQTGVPIFDIEKTKQDPVGVIQGVLDTNRVAAFRNAGGTNLLAAWKANPSRFCMPYTNDAVFYLNPDESPPLSDRADKVMSQIEKALPGILNLTNQIGQVLNHTVQALSNIDQAALVLKPGLSNANDFFTEAAVFARGLQVSATNIQIITSRLKGQGGSMGEWLLPTNIQQEIEMTLRSTSLAIEHNRTNLDLIVSNIVRSLDNLAGITGNLREQVAANTNMLSQMGSLVSTAGKTFEEIQGNLFIRVFNPSSWFRKTTPPAVRPEDKKIVVPSNESRDPKPAPK